MLRPFPASAPWFSGMGDIPSVFGDTVDVIVESYKVGTSFAPLFTSSTPRIRYLLHSFTTFPAPMAGLRKPDPKIFELVCSLLKSPPARTVFIDDIGVRVCGRRTCFPFVFPQTRSLPTLYMFDVCVSCAQYNLKGAASVGMATIKASLIDSTGACWAHSFAIQVRITPNTCAHRGWLHQQAAVHAGSHAAEEFGLTWPAVKTPLTVHLHLFKGAHTASLCAKGERWSLSL